MMQVQTSVITLTRNQMASIRPERQQDESIMVIVGLSSARSRP
ncbi:hypothetical protein [Gluconobacter thailandicus]|nr:hypothetical protein [Gluconobacter thailandicus]